MADAGNFTDNEHPFEMEDGVFTAVTRTPNRIILLPNAIASLLDINTANTYLISFLLREAEGRTQRSARQYNILAFQRKM